MCKTKNDLLVTINGKEFVVADEIHFMDDAEPKTTPLTPFLSHVLMCYTKNRLEQEANEKVDNDFFEESYKESVERWEMFNHVEGAYDLYQEVSCEVESDWYGRNSKTCLERAMEDYENMEDEDRETFLAWINKKDEHRDAPLAAALA